jgi:hypothetical protein
LQRYSRKLIDIHLLVFVFDHIAIDVRNHVCLLVKANDFCTLRTDGRARRLTDNVAYLKGLCIRGIANPNLIWVIAALHSDARRERSGTSRFLHNF